MKIKTSSAILAALLLISSAAYAYDGITVRKNDASVTVTAAAEPGAELIMVAVRAEHMPSETEYICVMRSAAAAEDGTAAFEFNMPDTVGGTDSTDKYNVYIRAAGSDMLSSSFWYTSPAVASRLETALAAAESGAALGAVLGDSGNLTALRGMDFDIDTYTSLSVSDKSSVLAIAAAQAGKGTDAMRAAFNNAASVAAVNSASGAMAAVLQKSALRFEDTGFADITDAELSAWISKTVQEHRPYENYTALEAEYASANILYLINNARFSELTGLIKKYASYLGIENDDTYRSYVSQASGQLNEKITKQLVNLSPNTSQGLLKIIRDCLPASGGSSGGSGGGGGSSGGRTNGQATGGYTGGGSSGTAATVLLPASQAVETAPQINTGLPFPDMTAAEWAIPAVSAAKEQGIISGDENGNFRPNDHITREEFVKLIVAAAGLEDLTARCEFWDVKNSAWYYVYVASGVKAGLINGIDDRYFGVGEQLTRQDMAVIAARAVGVKDGAGSSSVFTDDASISDYARDAIYTLYAAGLINGMDDGSFEPLSHTTRAQAAQMIYNLFVKEDEIK